MRINTNVASLNAQKNLWNTQQAQSRSMDKLSSGFRINRAGDDAAGLGIANKLRADNRSLQQAFRNSEQGNAVLQIAEGSTSTIQKMLERMKELATQASSDTVDDSNGRARLDTEFKELAREIDRIVGSTKYQGQTVLDGSFSGDDALTFQISSENNAAGRLSISLGSLDTTALGIRGEPSEAIPGNPGTPEVPGQAAVFSFATDAVADEAEITIGDTTWTADQAYDLTDDVERAAFLASLNGAIGDEGYTATYEDGSIVLTANAVGVAGIDEPTFDGDDFTVANPGVDHVPEVPETPGSPGSDGLIGLGSRDDAQEAMDSIDTALDSVNAYLGNIGAYQNRLEYTMSNLKTSIQNNSAAESVIRDLDMAEEMTNFSKLGILSQAGQAMLAQANQSTQGVLQLLRG